MGAKMQQMTVECEVVTKDRGHWCTRCNLPSGWRIWVAVHFRRSDGGHAVHLQTRLYCDECESGRHVQVNAADADHA